MKRSRHNIAHGMISRKFLIPICFYISPSTVVSAKINDAILKISNFNLESNNKLAQLVGCKKYYM